MSANCPKTFNFVVVGIMYGWMLGIIEQAPSKYSLNHSQLNREYFEAFPLSGISYIEGKNILVFTWSCRIMVAQPQLILILIHIVHILLYTIIQALSIRALHEINNQ